MNINRLDITAGFRPCLVHTQIAWQRAIFVVLLGLVLTACGSKTDDDDGAADPVRISVTPAATSEGDSGSRVLLFAVSLDAPASGEVRVDYATVDGSAQAGSDYQSASGTLIIPANATTATVPVTILGDTEVEGDETFQLRLSQPVNAELATAEATGTILNDDSAGLARISVTPAATSEGDSGSRVLLFAVSLDAPASGEVRVDYATVDGSAQAGSDYQSASGTLIIPANATTATVPVTILGDTEVEGDETFQLRLSQPVNAELATAEATGTIMNDDFVVTGSCVHTGSGNDYPVGPGQTYTSIADVPWGSLGPGDTVRIHYRTEPYREKIVIRTNGSEDQPIRLCGVPGPNGERPILDGDGAVNDPDDSDAYGGYAPMQGLAMVMLYNRDYDLKVHNVVIEGLHIRNAKNTFSYTRMDGSTDNYENGAACIRIQAADNVVIRGNELENCGNGIFTMSQGYNEAHLTRNLLIESNYLHGHGQAGSYLEHGVYIQAIGVVYQYNRFGANAPASSGVTLKERVAGSVIRYNWFDSGSSRMLDLVEVEDAAPWYLVSEYLNELGCTDVNNCPGIDPDRLAKVQAADAAYRETHVYGNFFRHVGSQTVAGNIVHYGSDNDPALSRAGTLYFYHNTLSIEQDLSDVWRFRLFYLGNRNDTARSRETLEVFNNIIYFTGESGEPSHFCLDDTNQGTINFGVNWMTDTWQGDDAASECYYGVPSDGPSVNGAANLLDVSTAPAPIDRETLESLDTPLLQGTAQAIPAGLPGATRQYVRHQQSAPRASVNNLGAME